MRLAALLNAIFYFIHFVRLTKRVISLQI